MSAMMNMTSVFSGTANFSYEANVTGNVRFAFLSKPSLFNTIINILTVAILFITMVSLGCTMEISKIKAHCLKPKGVVIAMLAQFGIMPLTAFCLAKMLQLDSYKAVTVLICGCCPGGSLSNIFTLAVEGDMNLSITMTTFSSIAALGMMPLLLFIYSQGFPSLKSTVPYIGIITALVLTLVPCSIGIAINHYKPKYTPIVKKGGLTLLVICGIIVLTMSAFAIKDILWMIVTPDIMTVAVVMPMTGFIMGYVMSVICRQSPKLCRTIAMETGCQNIQLCLAILRVTFSPQTIGALFLFPLIYFIVQVTEGVLLMLCFRCYRRFKPPAKETLTYEDSKNKCHLPLRSPHLSPNDITMGQH
ncbi:hepatic sodium/bile acid cotransporter-like [Labrus mixtus]|uniref:hepatic sodium/bile acid cotransporter-like n=1 Tax=Labrus mixtus TaxID=508554 RepID=UPI0029C0B598|nr:hepatic sodium/bile acid cotransporter-like [Labrus mixtus]XP_060919357.1 hepatic sodium/bile acid cotransporter-like [Labrus mixtus]XP_060919358.1 hepatic sodium/bile acid cotransporter-like [Labrus mixtus]